MQSAGAGLLITGAVPFGSPAYQAGLERDDTIVSIAGRRLDSTDTLATALRRLRPGDVVDVVFERRGQRVKGSLRLSEDPRIRIEDDDSRLTDAQRRFRQAWLSSRAMGIGF